MLEQNITFDIAIVDYNLRKQSKEEVLYAKELAKRYNKKIFLKEITLNNHSNFEKKARDLRYEFFNEIINEHNYNTLITAHQLNDKLEWFFMQLSKGAGIVELIGFNTWEEKQNYNIFKPLLEISKKQLEEYLIKHKHKYFVDDSNYDEKYKRNYFRHNFCDKFLGEFQDGISQSFNYIQKDLNSLNINYEPLIKINELEIFNKPKDENIFIRIIDNNLKKRGILISKSTRDEIIKQKELIISHKIALSITEDKIYISPFFTNSMDKKFKEKCRIKKIPKNIRPYIYDKKISLDSLII